MGHVGGGDIFVSGDRKWSGSGVIVLEDRFINNKKEVCLVVARNISRNMYNDFGGHYEKKYKRLSVNGHNELREESCNLLSIDPSVLRKNFCDSFYNNTYYRSYFIKINGIADKQYINNFNILKRGGAPSTWLETDALAHIPIKNIKQRNLSVKGDIYVKDVNEKLVLLHNRVRQCIDAGYTTMLDVATGKPCADARLDGSINTSSTFRRGTFTIKKSLSE